MTRQQLAKLALKHRGTLKGERLATLALQKRTAAPASLKKMPGVSRIYLENQYPIDKKTRFAHVSMMVNDFQLTRSIPKVFSREGAKKIKTNVKEIKAKGKGSRSPSAIWESTYRVDIQFQIPKEKWGFWTK